MAPQPPGVFSAPEEELRKMDAVLNFTNATGFSAKGSSARGFSAKGSSPIPHHPNSAPPRPNSAPPPNSEGVPFVSLAGPKDLMTVPPDINYFGCASHFGPRVLTIIHAVALPVRSRIARSQQQMETYIWTHWDLNPGPSAYGCDATTGGELGKGMGSNPAAFTYAPQW